MSWFRWATADEEPELLSRPSAAFAGGEALTTPEMPPKGRGAEERRSADGGTVLANTYARAWHPSGRPRAQRHERENSNPHPVRFRNAELGFRRGALQFPAGLAKRLEVKRERLAEHTAATMNLPIFRSRRSVREHLLRARGGDREMNAIKVHRFGNWLYRHHFRRSAMLVQRLLFLIYNSAVPCQVEIGEGTEFAYGGIGVVLHADTRIGRDVLISQHVTVGGRAPLRGVPVIEDGCFIGPGAVLLGPIRIGAGSIIGANAVVLSDVPARSVAAGVPAEIIRTDICTSDYYASHAAAGGEAVRLAAVSGKRG